YNNIMFLAAGRIIPAVTGRSWEDFVRDRILAPLGMTSTSTSVAALKNFDNVATPHTRTAGEVKPIAWRANDNVAPAGSICASVSDMARGLRLQLAQGSYEDKKLLSLGAVEEMQKPQMIVPYDAGTALGAPDARFMNSGFGWFLHDYHGRKVVRHGGNIDGMVAMVGMIPEEKLGVVILSNLDPGDLPSALMYRAFDAYLGLPEQEGRLLFYYNEVYSGELEHWHYDTFRITWGGAGTGDAFVTFTLSAQGRADEMKVQKLDDFKRVPESASARK